MSQEKNKQALFIGGHLAPALAVIEELGKRGGWEIFWVGRRFAMEVGEVPSLEYEVIPRLGIPFFDLRTGRLQRRFTSGTVRSLIRTVPGFFHAFGIVSKINPDVVVSFGGYLSVPVVLAAWVLHIPIVVHEQTSVSGLANRFAGFFATKIALSFKESAYDFPKKKIVLTGNPVSRSILEVKRKPTRPPTIYVTGGGQGSQTVNRVIKELLPRLAPRFSIIHQTGFLDYKYFLHLSERFKNYVVKSTVTRPEVVEILAIASLVISRGGANTICEIASVGVPAIIIPIPWSERGEQEKNAQILSKTGLAVVIEQRDLSKENLLEKINYMMLKPPSADSQKLARNLINPQAAKLIVDIIEKVSR